MSGGDLDRETRAAIVHLADRIRQRDETEPEDRADPEPLAHAYVMWLRIRGWRPEAVQPGAPRPGPARQGANSGRHAALLEKARADCARATARLKARKSGGPAQGRDRGDELEREEQ